MSLTSAIAAVDAAAPAINSVAATLATVSEVVQNIEANSTTGTTPLTGAQKLDMAVTVIGAINPQAGALGKSLETIVSTFVTLFNLTGLFKKKTP